MIEPDVPRSVAEIDWATWTASDPATLVFIVDGGRVLLIRKKRGLGAGKINGPGGRLEPGETPLQCAVRETQEEIGVTPSGLELVGENSFQFVDGYSTHVYTYRASGFAGMPVETDEAVPMWVALDAIPYAEMWVDDELWLPHLFAGRRFLGRYIFDGDVMVDHTIEVDAG